MKKNKLYVLGMLAGLLAFGMTVVGCATTIPVSVTEPARLNMSGVTRIAVLPFDTSDSSSLQGQVSASIVSFLEQQLSNTGRFELVSSSGIAQLKDRSSVAEAVIEGKIIVLSVKDGSTSSKRMVKDANGKEVEKTVVTYNRELTLNFTYKITRTRDNSVIGTESKSKKVEDSNEDKANLTDPFELAQKAISDTLGKVASDVAPSTYTVKRTLATLTKEESKNKELNAQMKEALKLVKAKDYVGAAAMYGSIHAGGTFAAGYNQALMTEATEGVDAAIALMTKLAQTKNPMAVSMLASLQKARAGEQSAAQQLAEGRPLIETAAEKIWTELLAKLSEGSRISLVGTSRGNTGDLDYVIGKITDNLVDNKGITVLDRQNQRFIEEEKKYQLSGDVSDETAVSIGHALGLTSIVFCSIDGEGQRRSLRVRAVDIETGEIIYTVSIEI